jgi:tryptophan synthase alpha chain
LREIRRDIDVPLLLMGYLNPVLKFGMEKFCVLSMETGIDGIILPDMPLEIYTEESHIFLNSWSDNDLRELGEASKNKSQFLSLHDLFKRNNLHSIFLISPQTSTERILKIDEISAGFIYMVSSSSTTGVKGEFTTEQVDYFRRIKKMNLKNPRLIGFGISNHSNFSTACDHTHGAIIGSAFVKMLSDAVDLDKTIGKFVKMIREN